MMARSDLKDQYMFANELKMDYRAGWIQDGSMDFNTQTFATHDWEFGAPTGYPAPIGRVPHPKHVGHSFVPHTYGFTFPVVVSKAYNDAFGYHWSTSSSVSDDWTLKTIFSKMVDGSAPSFSWKYPSAGTTGTREILGESFVTEFGSEHGFSQSAAGKANRPDGALHPNAAFGLDISGRMYTFDFSPIQKKWPSAIEYNKASREWADSDHDVFKLEYIMRRNRGMALFFQRHLMNDWSVSQERIQSILPGTTHRAHLDLPFAGSLIKDARISDSLVVPSKIELSNRFATDMFLTTPTVKIDLVDLSAFSYANVRRKFDISLSDQVRLVSTSFSFSDMQAAETPATAYDASSDVSYTLEQAALGALFPTTALANAQVPAAEKASYMFSVDAALMEVGGKLGPVQFVYNATSKTISLDGSQGDLTTSKVHLRAPSAGTFSFNLRVSSEAGWDYAYVYKSKTPTTFHDPTAPETRPENEQFLFRLAGEHESRFSVPISAGGYVAISYEKDWAFSEGEDKMWISNIVFDTVDTSLFTTPTGTSPVVEIMNGETVVATVPSPYNSVTLSSTELPAGADTYIRMQNQVLSSGAMQITQNTQPIANDYTVTTDQIMRSGASEQVVA
jgi:hypothetical protein